METLDEARYKVEPEPYGNFVATPAGVRASLDDPERKENPAKLSVTVRVHKRYTNVPDRRHRHRFVSAVRLRHATNQTGRINLRRRLALGACSEGFDSV